MKKYANLIIGLLIVALGIGMFFFGVAMFTYQGNHLNPIISKLGMYSFIGWLPTIGIGVFIMLLKKIFRD